MEIHITDTGTHDIKSPVNIHKTSTARLWISQLLKFLGPAFIVSVAYIDPGNFATNINPMKALVLSQVPLSFALPFDIIPLMLITGRKETMGTFVNKPFTKVLGWIIAGVIIALSVVLLYLTLTGNV